ncbi:hypothetical protein EVAR_103768_1 [Eumeta japonica]|uniref:Uncharacterized protein n=1 Tax=Eumeta variegata TaxID=151549 RepID=A0A4C1SCN1_EUMVA|nr:hypothetical protein EVAR_103768_1 [Eumeta japonica]
MILERAARTRPARQARALAAHITASATTRLNRRQWPDLSPLRATANSRSCFGSSHLDSITGSKKHQWWAVFYRKFSQKFSSLKAASDLTSAFVAAAAPRERVRVLGALIKRILFTVPIWNRVTMVDCPK